MSSPTGKGPPSGEPPDDDPKQSTPLSTTPPSKDQVFEEFMKADHALLHLDSSRPGVDVPVHLMGNPSLTLKLSYAFQGETTHDGNEIVTYLRFEGNYYRCVLPWSAIWGMTGSDGKNIIWPQDLPFEVMKRLAVAKLGELTGRFFPKRSAKKKPGAADHADPSDEPPRVARPSARQMGPREVGHRDAVPLEVVPLEPKRHEFGERPLHEEGGDDEPESPDSGPPDSGPERPRPSLKRIK